MCVGVKDFSSLSVFVSFLFLIKDKHKKGWRTDKNLDGNESEEAEIEEVKNLFFWRRKRIYLRTSKYDNMKHLLISKSETTTLRTNCTNTCFGLNRAMRATPKMIVIRS